MPEHPDPSDSPGVRECRDCLEAVAVRDPRVRLELLDFRDLLAAWEVLDHLGLQGPMAPRDRPEHPETPASLAARDRWDLRDPSDFRAQTAVREVLEWLELLVLTEHRDSVVHKVNPGQTERLGSRDPRE